MIRSRRLAVFSLFLFACMCANAGSVYLDAGVISAIPPGLAPECRASCDIDATSSLSAIEPPSKTDTEAAKFFRLVTSLVDLGTVYSLRVESPEPSGMALAVMPRDVPGELFSEARADVSKPLSIGLVWAESVLDAPRFSVEASAPEPAAFLLVIAGLTGVAFLRRVSSLIRSH